MERTDWPGSGLTPADVRFLMMRQLAIMVIAEESAALSDRQPCARRGTESGGKAA
ncbi:MAG TPA: hypothetical protein VMI73_03430 [Trebonia sp.]|nr:hypothetical protein [Trebonia sp.]